MFANGLLPFVLWHTSAANANRTHKKAAAKWQPLVRYDYALCFVEFAFHKIFSALRRAGIWLAASTPA